MWGVDQRRWVAAYLDACTRYFSGKLDVEISFTMECAETSYPRDRIEGGFISVEDTLKPLAESAQDGGLNGVVVVSWHRGDWQKASQAGAESTSDAEAGWAFVRYDPPVTSAPRYIYKNLVVLSHEWLHLILGDLDGALKTGDIDRPPYRDKYTIVEFQVEGKYPVQSLEEMDVSSLALP